MKHISRMSYDEMCDMRSLAAQAMVEYAEKNNFSGLSHNGWFNFYAVLYDAIEEEWKKAKVLPRKKNDD